MSGDKDDHWGKLLTDFGIGKLFGKKAKKDDAVSDDDRVVEAADVSQGTATDLPSEEVKLDRNEEQGESSTPESKPVAQSRPRQRKPNRPRPESTSWDALGNELGLDPPDPPPTLEADSDPNAGDDSEEAVESSEALSSPDAFGGTSRKADSPLDEMFNSGSGDDDKLDFLKPSGDSEIGFASFDEVGDPEKTQLQQDRGDSEPRGDSSGDDRADDSDLDSIEVVVEDLETHGNKPPRRRQRSRTRRSLANESTQQESTEQEATEQEATGWESTAPESSETISSDLGDEKGDGDSPAAIESRDAGTAGEAKRSGRPRRRRSRGSRKPKETAAREESAFDDSVESEVESEFESEVESEVESLDEADAPKSEQGGRSRRRRSSRGGRTTERDRSDEHGPDDDQEPESDAGDDSRRRRSKGKKIPDWLECVGVMVEANIERHKKSGGDRKRSAGRPRSRRGGSGRNRS